MSNSSGWVAVVEQGETWTAMLRSRLTRLAAEQPAPEVRRLASPPKPALLDRNAAQFFCVELTGDNTRTMLTVLSELRELPYVAAAALLARHAISSGEAKQELASAALEAGACLALDSPREIDRLAPVALAHLCRSDAALSNRLTLTDQARLRLPWQLEPWPLG